MALTDWLAEQRQVSARTGVSYADVAEQHTAIFDAIAARDSEAAQSVMEAHLTAVADNYWKRNRGRREPLTAVGGSGEPDRARAAGQ